MGVAQALALERFLEGEALAKKPGATLLTGSGAKLLRASDLPTASSPAASSLLRTLPALDAVFSGGLPDRRLIELVGRRSAGRFSIAVAALACAGRARGVSRTPSPPRKCSFRRAFGWSWRRWGCRHAEGASCPMRRGCG